MLYVYSLFNVNFICLAIQRLFLHHGKMSRPKKVTVAEPLAETIGSDQQLSELADERHNLNTLVTTSDWEMLKEAAFFENTNSVSDLIRMLISTFLAEHPQREHFREVAMLSLREELARREKRNRIRTS
jgi:hypothetical protein